MKHAIPFIMCLALFACDSVPPQQIAPVEEPAELQGSNLNLEIPEEDVLPESPKEESEAVDEHDDAEGLRVRRIEITDEIHNREPVAARELFEEAEKLYLFLDMRNDSDIVRQIHVFFVGPDGGRRGNVKLRIPANAPRWRTWAYTKYAQQAGIWKAVVTLDGEQIASKQFEIL